MAAPTLLSPIDKYVVVTVDTGTGVTSNLPNMRIGLVESVGLGVTQVAVGQYIMFQNGLAFSESPTSWVLVLEENINSVITPAP